MAQPKKIIYLDHAAATPIDPRVRKAMEPFLNSEFANPSALYTAALVARKAIELSRKKVANVLHTQPDCVVFTNGGTESNNLALLGTARAHEKQGKHIIISAVEHSAMLEPAKALEKKGWKISVIPVDKNGVVNVNAVVGAIRPDTVFVSIIYANNEIGSIQPISEIGRAIVRYRKEHKTNFPYFHTDAAQAAGFLVLDVEKLHVDFMSFNGGKMYGPRGSGVLYLRRGITVEPLMYGGSQEHALRPGTENTAAIVGFATALQIAQKNMGKESEKLQELSSLLWNKLKNKAPGLQLNGPEIGPNRLSNNLNIFFPGVDGETFVIYLSEEGVYVSTGSSCNYETASLSPVLKAIGLPDATINGSVRFSLGRSTTKKDINFVVTTIINSIKILT